MSNLISILKRFNTKERFYLISYALGNKEFTLSAEFINALNSKLSLNIPTENVFVGVDYHLDWVYGSLELYQNNILPDNINCKNRYDQQGKQMIYGTQEDSDMVICYRDNQDYHIIFIEAKGVTSWNSKQLYSKANRLKDIFGDENYKWKNVCPYFLVISPGDLCQIDDSNFPNWAFKQGKIPQLKLDIPNDLVKITRCSQSFKNDKDGAYWKVDKIKNKTTFFNTQQNKNSSARFRYHNENNDSKKWLNMFSDKYADNLKSLRFHFPEAYNFLKDLESLEKHGFHMGTAVNMHFYYKDNFLFYFKFRTKAIIPGNPVVFSPNYNLQLKHDASKNNPEIFFISLNNKINDSGILAKGKVEKGFNNSGNISDLSEFFVFPFDKSSQFFNICRTVLSEISKINVGVLFPKY